MIFPKSSIIWNLYLEVFSNSSAFFGISSSWAFALTSLSALQNRWCCRGVIFSVSILITLSSRRVVAFLLHRVVEAFQQFASVFFFPSTENLRRPMNREEDTWGSSKFNFSYYVRGNGANFDLNQWDRCSADVLSKSEVLILKQLLGHLDR